ncbi:MAG: hypothetical protein HY026_03650 [Deltaproteobacteria bacterium]|nr:hypothetical protein [Deltaproteobacteria bacterium]
MKSEYLKGERSEVPHFLGINYFRQNNVSFFNKMSIAILNVIFKLKYTGKEEQNRYGYDKTGGAFIGRFAKSVNPGAEDKDVFQINYRFSSLNNPFPLKYLIDEIVEVAPGLYLGQLLFATERILKPYDPSLPDREYGYEYFGCFLLMDDEWYTRKIQIGFDITPWEK